MLSIILTTNDRGASCSIGIRDDAECVTATSNTVRDCTRDKSNITSLSVEGKEVKSQTAHIWKYILSRLKATLVFEGFSGMKMIFNSISNLFI